jgi:hypothetical protein
LKENKLGVNSAAALPHRTQTNFCVKIIWRAGSLSLRHALQILMIAWPARDAVPKESAPRDALAQYQSVDH